MNADSEAEKEYVEPSQHDMRRSRQVNADMVKKLQKQEEENKEERKTRPSREHMRARGQSFLLATSFAPMRPVVLTKEIET